MVDNSAVENSKYKLLGFENSKELAVIMIISTGKIVKVNLGKLMKSDILDNLNKAENYSDKKVYYSRKDILKLYQEDEIIKITRKLSDLNYSN